MQTRFSAQSLSRVLVFKKKNYQLLNVRAFLSQILDKDRAERAFEIAK